MTAKAQSVKEMKIVAYTQTTNIHFFKLDNCNYNYN